MKYSELPRHFPRPLRRYLWLAPDHLLVIYRTFFFERYRRFYFADIQSVTIQKTPIHLFMNMIILSLAAIAFGLRFGSFTEIEYTRRIVLPIAGFILLGAFVANSMLGPTCRFRIQTGVQSVFLLPVNRLHAARDLLKLLDEKVIQTQGPMLDATALRLFSVQSTGAPPSSAPNIPGGGFRAGAHSLLFTILLLDGFFAGVLTIINHVALQLLSLLFFVAITVSLAVALVRQRGMTARHLRAVTWTVLGYLIIFMLVGWIYGMSLIVGNPDAAGNQWTMIKAMGNVDPDSAPAYLAIQMCASGISIVLALLGFGAIIHARRTQ